MNRIERIVTSEAITERAAEIAVRWAAERGISIEEAAEQACEAVAAEVVRNVVRSR